MRSRYFWKRWDRSGTCWAEHSSREGIPGTVLLGGHQLAEHRSLEDIDLLHILGAGGGGGMAEMRSIDGWVMKRGGSR